VWLLSFFVSLSTYFLSCSDLLVAIAGGACIALG
jgi:hypothetical protein